MILCFLAALAGLENFINAPLEREILRFIGIEHKYKFIFMVGIPTCIIGSVAKSRILKMKKAENENGDDEAKNE